jgi:hypothetical protein
MKRFFSILIITVFLITGNALSAHAQRGQGKANRTSGAQAAYGNSVTFKSHQKKNKKAKRNAFKSAKRKKLRDNRDPYRRGMPI